MISWGLINFENECFFVTNFICPPQRSQSNVFVWSLPVKHHVHLWVVWRWISLLYQSLVQSVSFSFSSSLLLLSTQITVIQAHELNIIPPFDIVVLQSHSDASQLITLCTLKYTNACVRSFVNELLFNYNFTWTLLISGANRVSPSARNYSGYNCSACLWDMLVSQQGHPPQILCEGRPPASEWFLFEAADRTGSFWWTNAIKIYKRQR